MASRDSGVAAARAGRPSHSAAARARRVAVSLRIVAAVAAAVAAAGPAGGAPLDDLAGRPNFAASLRAPHVPPDVRVLANVAYGSDPRQRIDVYLPPLGQRAAQAQAAPVIVMVHGGAWMVGNKALPQVVENKVARWVTRGAIFVSVGYRLLPQAGPVEQADDVAHALAKVQALAESWGGNPEQIVLMGHSAGAHLVALIGASPALAARAGVRPWRGTVVLDSAALDLPTLMAHRHAAFYDRVFGADPAAWRAASPFDALIRGAPPLLLVCSTQRPDHSCDQADAFAARAVALGTPARVSRQNLSHAEINATLGLPGSETDAVEAFFDSIGIGGH